MLLLALPDQALANNGLNLIGFSAEGVGMGGADVAVARDALSLGINPAGLSQLDRPRFDGLAAVAYADTSHRDEFAGWVGNENKVLYLGNLGLAAPLPKLGLTWEQACSLKPAPASSITISRRHSGRATTSAAFSV